MDYHKLNRETLKDHYLIPLIDQMLDMPIGFVYYCFLGQVLGYNHIVVPPRYQEKSTLICLHSIYVFKIMPFGLCYVTTTFKRFIMEIFCSILEDFIEVFMNDFSIFDNSFKVLQYNHNRVHTYSKKNKISSELGEVPCFCQGRHYPWA